jgi:hypothetical protein
VQKALPRCLKPLYQRVGDYFRIARNSSISPVQFVLRIFFEKYWTRKPAPRTFPKFL